VFFEERLAHYTAREELVLEHAFLRATPQIWEQRLDSFEYASPLIQDSLNEEVSPGMMATLPLPVGWEKLSDEMGTFFYYERTDTSTRERPHGTSPRGFYEVLLYNFSSYLIKSLPWYGGKGPSVKSGPDDYDEDDRLYDEKSQVKKKVISAMHVDAETSSQAEASAKDNLNAGQRRTLECYCILRREELRLSSQLKSGKQIMEAGKTGEGDTKPKKIVLLGLCGYWNPLVAMKVLSVLMENINATFIVPTDKNENSTLAAASSSSSSSSKASSLAKKNKLEAVTKNHIIPSEDSNSTNRNLPLDFEVASSEYESRLKRLVQLGKAEKTLKRLQGEGKGEGEQALKLKKDLVKLRAAFDGKDIHICMHMEGGNCMLCFLSLVVLYLVYVITLGIMDFKALPSSSFLCIRCFCK
jgi:hypothetical protein